MIFFAQGNSPMPAGCICDPMDYAALGHMTTCSKYEVRLENGPDLWNAILARMQPGAVIAGGAVRDYLLGVEPKDIDVFMGTELPESADPLDFYDARSGLYRIDNTYERQAEYAALTNIALVSSGQMFGRNVDTIVVEHFNPETLVEGFDFGITRCWFDGEIRDTPEAAHDRANHVVTLLLTDRIERAEKRFARFNDRMNGIYRLVRQ